MKFNISAIALITFIFSANIYIYLQHLQLLKEVGKADSACTHELTKTAHQYENKINDLSADLKGQSDFVDTEKTPIKSNLDMMASYGHLLGAVSQKYEFLLRTVKLQIEQKKKLLKFLIEREKLNSVALSSLAQTNDEERSNYAARLTDVEKSIKEILMDSVDYQRYEYLRNRSL
jgi:hypothetical protein